MQQQPSSSPGRDRSNGQDNGKPHGDRHDDHAHHEENPIPQDLPKLGFVSIALMALAIVVLLGALFLLGWMPHRHREAELQSEAAEARESRPVVEVAPPKRSPTSTDLLLPGDVQPLQTTALYARTNGYLKRVLADIGDHVKAGQLLAEIDSPEIDAELEQAKAALQQAEVTVGRANNEYAFNKSTYERYEGLSKSGGVTQQQLDEKRASFNIATSSLAAAKAAVAAAQASVKRYTELQGFEKVIAPFDGTVTARDLDVGALISTGGSGPGKELFHLDHTDTLRVFVNVPQTHATSMKNGQPAELLVRNYPGRAFKGMVTRSTGAIDQATRTLRTEVDFPNDQHELFPGMYGQVRFHIVQEQAPLIVPTSALVFQPDGMKVAVVDGGKVHYQKVGVGRDFGTEAEVDGLSGNEQIVTNPGERLVEGAQVSIASQQRVAAAPAPQAEARAR